MSESPTLDVLADGIPEMLRQLPQWVAWRLERGNGKKPTKVPYVPDAANRKASVSDEQSWVSCTLAVDCYRNDLSKPSRFDGIGFVFAKGGGLVGIDLDGCRDRETGTVSDWAKPILSRFASTYAEVSPSGTGIKIITRGKLPIATSGGKVTLTGPHCGIEAYQHSRYFCITGHRVEGHAAEPADCEEAIDWLWNTHFKKPNRASKSTANNVNAAPTAAEKCRKYLDKLPPAIERQDGSGRAFHAACEIAKFGLDGSEARSAFEHFNVRCVPPWSECEIQHKLAQAKQRVIDEGTFGSKGQQKPTQNLSVSPPSTEIDRNAGSVAGRETVGATLPEVILPGHSQTITDSASELGRLLGETGRFYVRGGVPVRQLKDVNQVKLDTLRPAAACSDFEGVAKLLEWKECVKQGLQLKPTICKEQVAKQIVTAESFRGQLPSITVLSHCPVLHERNGQLVVITDYDRESGIWAQGEKPPEMSVDEARELLSDLFAEFNFETPSDRSRALAAVITPALIFGGLLGGRAPVDLGEADSSQAGKGYRNKLTTAIYRHAIKTVTQRERGVGGPQESFDAKLVAGATFISLDNLRGKLDSPWLESFLTEPTYSARIPYSAPVEIETGRVIVMLTTNRADLTIDMANRSSIVRLQKSAPGTVFRSYPEGDLLAHVVANQSKYLGAVFTIVQEWFRRGKPSLAVGDHDFRAWASKLGWIVQHLLGAAPLMDGHREVQERIATPGANWLRDVALAVKNASRTEEWLRAGDLLRIIVEAGIETAGIDPDADPDDDETFPKLSRAVGRKMGGLVKDGSCTLVGSAKIERRSGQDTSFRTKTEYRFGTAETATFGEAPPNAPPRETSDPPIPPIANQTLYAGARAHTHEESSASLWGIGGALGEDCDHLDPEIWSHRDGGAYCRVCGRFMGRVRDA